MDTYIGIDWGGTYIKSGLVSEKGTVIAKEVFSSSLLKKKKVFIETVSRLVKKYANRRIGAIGIGAPGIIDTTKGFIYYLPNIAGWKNYPLKTILQKKLRVPVFVDNDANVFALAEARLGAAKKTKRAIFLTLGTGLGGAVIWNGNILEGRASASEIGHVPIAIEGRPCSCGGNGCIETFVGAPHLLSHYALLEPGARVTEVKEIFRRALAHDPSAITVWRNFAHALGKFLGGMVNIFNPEIIVLGGGVAGAFSFFKPLLERAIRTQAMWPNHKGLRLVRARLSDPGIIGAGLLAKERLNRASQSYSR
ncbi:MAG: ROK family protein [Candidatus Omnitrophota bacterium]|nr:ROK family protein [Candidatus Omnitrophota bacterium]